MKTAFPLSLLLMSFAVSGCSAVLSHARPADELYVLKAQESPVSGKMLGLSIRIDDPDAAPGLDTARIAVLEDSNHLTYYTGATWAQPLPDMVQLFLVDALQQSHNFKSVSSDDEIISADVVMLINIQDYEVDNSSNPPSVHVGLVVKLADARNHKSIASFPIDKTVGATVNHMPDIVDAFNSAMNEAAGDIIRGTVTALKKR